MMQATVRNADERDDGSILGHARDAVNLPKIVTSGPGYWPACVLLRDDREMGGACNG